MLDGDLARIYGVTLRRLNALIQRDRRRFPKEFMLRLSPQERRDLRPRIATPHAVHYAFTEHGAVLLAALLGTPAAIRACVRVVQAFARLPAPDPDFSVLRESRSRFTLYPPIFAKP